MPGKLRINFKVAIIGIAVLLLILRFAKLPIFGANEFLLERYSGLIVTTCKEESYKPLCYEKEILKVARFLKMEDSFRLTRLVQSKDPSYAYCHVLAHKISFLESKRRPGEWKDIMSRCPAVMCNYGCLHGALIEHFRGETLSAGQIKEAEVDLKDVCEPRPGFNPTEIDRTMCYHALGHLTMYMTGGDPTYATSICKNVSIKPDGRDYYETCVEGVFMTIFQGVDPEDIALVADIKPKKEEVRGFCSKFTGIEYEACNRESYPVFRDELKEVSFIPKFCSYTKTDYGDWKCYATTLGDVTVEILEGRRTESFKEICDQLPRSKVARCYANIAARMVQVEPQNLVRAVGVCRDAEKIGMGDECYNDLISYAVFTTKPGSEDFINYCSNFEEKWKSICLNQK